MLVVVVRPRGSLGWRDWMCFMGGMAFERSRGRMLVSWGIGTVGSSCLGSRVLLCSSRRVSEIHEWTRDSHHRHIKGHSSLDFNSRFYLKPAHTCHRPSASKSDKPLCSSYPPPPLKAIRHFRGAIPSFLSQAFIRPTTLKNPLLAQPSTVSKPNPLHTGFETFR